MVLETPPRAWGRPVISGLIIRAWGNTPTCVGKTPPLDALVKNLWKHPHVRGEDCHAVYGNRPAQETPPRTWGRPEAMRRAGEKYRNTPTCVGKTLRDYSLFLLNRQNNIEASSFSDTSCSPDNSMSWRFGSPMP